MSLSFFSFKKTTDVYRVENPYWGHPTGNVVFCEHAYEKSHYIAEFFNTISNIVYLLAGVYGIYVCRKYKLHGRFQLTYFMMIIIGIGSSCFHGTQQLWGEYIDEIAMIILTFCFLENQISYYSVRNKIVLSLFFIALLSGSILYVHTNDFAIFHNAFGAGVALNITWSLFASKTPIIGPKITKFGICVFAVGSIFWLLEQSYCTSELYHHVKWFHPVWHLTSAIAGYLMVVSCIFACYERTDITKISNLRESEDLETFSAQRMAEDFMSSFITHCLTKTEDYKEKIEKRRLLRQET